ncbi:MAG: carboxymuconolactone decarboxylase family protein [Alphaproteobacteria bacterium]|jgi:uncharacterized peroxidase-related enzyme|nr:carboxymuconolactone decarboxylase family protein [Alphaproteobacteria bacterium]
MPSFPIHTTETAPPPSRPRLQAAETRYGFLPNLLGGLAEAPAALDGYLTLAGILDTSTLSQAEKEVLFLAASVVNNCGYCVAAHSTAADLTLPAGQVAALRAGRPLADPKLEALRRFTEALMIKQGWVEDDEVEAFLDAGYGRGQVLEVVLGIALKTISNYANHLIGTPLDAAIASRAWAQGGPGLSKSA